MVAFNEDEGDVSPNDADMLENEAIGGIHFSKIHAKITIRTRFCIEFRSKWLKFDFFCNN